MKKLLIPFDRSESAMRAVHYAASRVKAQPDYEVHLLHVVEPLNLTTDPNYWQPDVQHNHLEKGEQTIAQARQVFEKIGVTPKCTMHMGYPHHDVVNYVRNNGCAEIVMGSRGMGPAAAFFVGSVAIRILQYVDCPVTLVK